MKELEYDIAVIGGGPAGLAAAAEARKSGCPRVVILERDREPGGILNQCIHNGFGLHAFGEELTGPEYAGRFLERAEEERVEILLNTMVTDLSAGEDGCRILTALSGEKGLIFIKAKAVVLAMGCRERPRGALNIPGFRPAGIYTAGTAQRFVNMEGILPGREAVILGSGDIGLIMARRLTLEGAKVRAVAEIMPYSGGLRRNIVQCLEDYDIPLKLSTTVVNIKGKDRVEAVVLAKVDSGRRVIPGTQEEIACDTLLLSCGLIPENELTGRLGAKMSSVTGGPVVDARYETSVPGVFACGNVLHVHDLADYVTQEAALAGRFAAEYAAGGGILKASVEIVPGAGVRYTVPSFCRPGEGDVSVKFRVDAPYRDRFISVYFDGERVYRRRKKVLAPGEMEAVTLQNRLFVQHPDAGRITVCLEAEE